MYFYSLYSLQAAITQILLKLNDLFQTVNRALAVRWVGFNVHDQTYAQFYDREKKSFPKTYSI